MCCSNFATVVSAAQWQQHTSKAEFQALLDNNELTLVAFVSPWTPPSLSLAEEWATAKSQLTQPLANVDCTAERDLCAEHDVRSYPAIRLFRGLATTNKNKTSSTTRYRGPRKASSIVPFVRRAALPPVSTVTVENLTGLTSIDRVVFVAYLDDDDVTIKARYTKVARELHDRFVFGIAQDEQLDEQEGIDAPSIVAYKTDVGDRDVLSVDTATTKRVDIEKFVLEASTPLIGELTRRNEGAYLSGYKLLAYIFVSNDRDRSSLRRELYPVAKEYKDYINFVTIDSHEYGHMAPGLGLSAAAGDDDYDHESGYPALTVYSAWKDQVFPYPETEELEAEQVEAFLLQILHGERGPWDPSNKAGSSGHDEL
ncbi:protein disulfide-isomerase precursor [Knufia peltigerae]|uniref:Protein disulfide-isomerase n=1 Tax=Knufia peltigerae TaxID=1002370 RepID=A0AA38XQY2_9EURO|nr:protein disulfide-isomerase precursor [Knufia peltigerae]